MREFLSESVELVSSGMPTESMESLADIDALTAGKRPADPGFLDDAVSALGHWLAMSAAEQKANSARFVQVRGIVLGRIAREATAAQQARLKKFVERWKAAPDGT